MSATLQLPLIDDMSFLEKIPQLVTTSEMVRGSGGLIIALSQSFEGLKSDYGEKEAEALLTNFPIQIFLGANTLGTAKWSAGAFGDAARYEDVFSRSFGGGQVQCREDKRRTVESLIKSADILNLKPPSPDSGFTFYMKTPQWGQEFAKHIPWHQVMQRTAPKKKAILTELPKQFQRPEIWNAKDLQRLLKGKPSRVNQDVTSPSTIADNLRLFEAEVLRCLDDLAQLGAADVIQHLSQFLSTHNKDQEKDE
ncbi:TraM recognition domain-containing protein [Acaryochloris sp. CCMEE 5410]|uniref:TraM recognition domain-containing protein n=1 Tax=Acaryochloris sp. CCMEE 5410 TaxID=310037 RepID=UPI001111E8C0|nr:TraM recognition domain-containing protein [Acaryochloris sp. CCMEE 5410]